jgi:type II secretory pathway component GspD/PulD (secretin)
MMTVLPRIVEGNRILMRLSVAITDAAQPFATFTSGSGTSAASIQLPEVETTGFLQNAVVTSGETLVLAGFEKNLNSSTNQGTPLLPILGGSKSTNRDREVTVMLITSEILPEEPITVIGDQ